MRHVTRLEDANPTGMSIVAVGVFDGVHRGHQYLLRQLVKVARMNDCVPTVLTFFPHPDIVLGKAAGRYYLTSPDERAAQLGKIGIQCVITHPFNDEVRQIRAAEFVDQMIRHLHLRELWIGSDSALGYKREGTPEFLRAQGELKGFKVEVVDLVTNDDSGQIIDSTSIRAALEAGKVEQAAQWLGRPYRLAGEVVHGEGRGRLIGFPTANMDVWVEQVLPENGVYAGWATLNGETFMSVANVGVRPTFNGTDVRVEAHILDFDRDIYGQTLEFEFVARLRPELRYESVDDLVAQMHKDVIQGRELLTVFKAKSGG